MLIPPRHDYVARARFHGQPILGRTESFRAGIYDTQLYLLRARYTRCWRFQVNNFPFFITLAFSQLLMIFLYLIFILFVLLIADT